MRTRTSRALQRLALIAGMCAGAWLAAEGLDHGTAHADDVPVRTEQPGGLLDGILDVLPEPPARPTPEPDPDPQPEPEPAQTEEPDRPQPIEDILDDVGEVVTPDPADGDDGSPQHPVDTPPDSGPTPTPADPPAAPAIETPAEPERPSTDPPAGDSLAPPFGGYHPPATYAPAYDSQAGPDAGAPVCDGRGSAPTLPRPGTRDRLAPPRSPAGPGPSDNGCDLTAGSSGGHLPTAAAPHPDPPPGAPPADYWTPETDPGTRHERHDDRLPVGRLPVWPPGPG